MRKFDKRTIYKKMDNVFWPDGKFWPHCFILVVFVFFTEQGCAVREWLAENASTTSRWEGSIIQFRDEDTALLFKVIWG